MSLENHVFDSQETVSGWRPTIGTRSLLNVVWLAAVAGIVVFADTYVTDYRQRAAVAKIDSSLDSRISAVTNNSTEIEKETAPSPTTSEFISPELPDAALVPAAPAAPPDSAVVPPIRHQAPLHEEMLTPGNFEYLGAFRPPHVKTADQSFGFGGWAMAYSERGDANGETDGHPGSLYLSGHRQQDLVAEISIPRLLISPSHSMDELPVATVLQPLSDVTAGIRDYMTQGSSEPFQIGGLCVVGDRLHWTLYKYYNVGSIDYPSHGSSALTLSDPAPEGLWHLGPSDTGRSQWHSYKHAGYIFEIPDDQARQWWFGGRNLISGLQIATGLDIASHGPAMFAYGLPLRSAAETHDIDAIPLLYNELQRPAPGFNPADRWTGGAWLTLNDKHTVIITGRQSLGQSYYGEARPQDCSTDKGFHGAPYEAQVRFYAPQALAASAAGKIDPCAVTPWDVWNHNSPGGGFSQYLFPTCTQLLGGLAYDRRNNLLYLAQINGGTTKDEPYVPLPVIHVFRIVP